VTMKNTVFWDVVPCRSCVNRRFGGTYRLHLHGRKIRDRGTRWLQTEPPVENTQLNKNRAGGRGSGPHGKSIKRRGVGCRDGRAGSRGWARTGIGFPIQVAPSKSLTKGLGEG
jgi:hypothetical protein